MFPAPIPPFPLPLCLRRGRERGGSLHNPCSFQPPQKPHTKHHNNKAELYFCFFASPVPPLTCCCYASSSRLPPARAAAGRHTQKKVFPSPSFPLSSSRNNAPPPPARACCRTPLPCAPFTPLFLAFFVRFAWVFAPLFPLLALIPVETTPRGLLFRLHPPRCRFPICSSLATALVIILLLLFFEMEPCAGGAGGLVSRGQQIAAGVAVREAKASVVVACAGFSPSTTPSRIQIRLERQQSNIASSSHRLQVKIYTLGSPPRLGQTRRTDQNQIAVDSQTRQLLELPLSRPTPL